MPRMLLAVLLAVCLGPSPLGAATEAPPVGLSVARASGSIDVDGQLGDEGWREASPVETWFETNPGDNVPPVVKNTAWLAYDDRFLYAAFEFGDPNPRQIRAPLSDRDNVGSDTDYGGLILDTRNDGKTGLLLLANPRGIQYDAVSDDAGGGEDSSPDFFWESAGRIHEKGWTLEIRVPFSSLRYDKAGPQTWGIMLYRNYPRAYRYQIFSTRLPRGKPCFICSSGKLEGLSGLPGGGHIVVAPYANGSVNAEAADGGSLDYGSPAGALGLDVKWTPNADTALDATVNPDFSQIESDVALIGANERFALFFPEKRPFFLEGIELFSTPLRAVYTRTITDPLWGTRGTGKNGRLAYTGLLAQDEGGGSVIVPGPESSDLADQDFRSWVGIGRLRYDFGRSFGSVLLSDREVEGGGYNRLLGPDFQWRPRSADNVTGQVLWSDNVTPDRPDLEVEEWDGRRRQGHAADLWWQHSTATVDWFGEVRDVSAGFRADNGFIPQVGYRLGFGEVGYTFRPHGLLRRLRPFAFVDYSADRDGRLLSRRYALAAGMDGRWSSFLRLIMAFDRVRSGDLELPRTQLVYVLRVSPNRWLSLIVAEGFVGQEIDFDNHRTGTGADIKLFAIVRPTDHLELRFNFGRRWLDVDPGGLGSQRLFSAEVNRLRATYNFSSRVFVRAIGQYVRTRRDPSLYVDQVDAKEGGFSGSALFAYKLNWQTVLFVGYGDDQEYDAAGDLRPASRQFFAKVSYAFQR